MDNGLDPLMYRLWGLQPLQTQLVRRGEAVLEVWARPARGVRQAMIRVSLRSDGRAFVQARAGLGCCDPEIGRRIAIDAELPRDKAAAVGALIDSPLWRAPRNVEAVEADGSAFSLCVDGVSWDLTLVAPGRSSHLRRACSDEEIGSVAPVLTAALSAALGLDPRFDVIFPRGADFSEAKRHHDELLARGGKLRPTPTSRPQPAEEPVVDETPPANPQ